LLEQFEREWIDPTAALKPRKRPLPNLFMMDSARILRAELPVQRKSTL